MGNPCPLYRQLYEAQRPNEHGKRNGECQVGKIGFFFLIFSSAELLSSITVQFILVG